MRWLLLLLVLGCGSAPQRIAGHAGQIRGLADSSRDRFVAAGDSAGESEQEQIIDLAAEIGVDAAVVDPTEPRWLSTLELALWSSLAIAAVVIVWQTGIGTLIRRILGWIPQDRRGAAKLLRESIQDPQHIREAVAAIRTADPLIDAAYRSTTT